MVLLGLAKRLSPSTFASSSIPRTLWLFLVQHSFPPYFSQSQKEIFKLFEPAFADWEKYGYKSDVHVIIINEINSITKIRVKVFRMLSKYFFLFVNLFGLYSSYKILWK